MPLDGSLRPDNLAAPIEAVWVAPGGREEAGMSADYTEAMVWQRMLDLTTTIHALQPRFAASRQEGVFEDLRAASARSLIAVADLLEAHGPALKSAPAVVRGRLRELENLGHIVAGLDILSADEIDRLRGIHADVLFLLRSHGG